MNDGSLIKAMNVRKIYGSDGNELEILKGVDLTIEKNEAVCITGASGAGKSTLLHILGALDRPNYGQVFFEGENIYSRNSDELADFRNQKMGFVFQFHHLLPEFDALENVMMPALIGNQPSEKAKEKSIKLLEQLGLKDRLHHFPSQLSGGEQQRVAIARALINDPAVLFCDEPTGNLDTANSSLIQDLFFKLKDSLGLTLVVVTHDMNFAEKFPRKLSLKDGQWS